MKRIVVFSMLLLFSYKIYSQIVPTQYGPVQGHSNGAIYEFLGIPFAAPPIDSLRWRPTQEHSSWTDTVMADNFPPKCPQKEYQQGDTSYTIQGQEDCLYLNVWSPDLSGHYPVMVFIHGGGNQQGSTSGFLYNGKNLSERGKVVVVTIQYRLSALGFLVHPGLELENEQGVSGNYAVMDQIMALKWVQNNISNFGGDNKNVTIFGESAGGINVGNLLTTQLASGLFHKAIIESGGPIINNYNFAKKDGIDFVNKFISDGTDSTKISYMRNLPSDSLIIGENAPFAGGIVQLTWQPVIDGVIFIKSPKDIFQTGNYNRVPLIIGSNADEVAISVPNLITPTMVEKLITDKLPTQYQETALALYPPGNNNEEARNSYIGILTDMPFTTSARRNSQCISLNQTQPVWRYFFTHTQKAPILNKFGSYHGIELFYVFNTWEDSPFAIGSLFTPQDDSVQKNTLKYWTNFAYTGNPNGEGLENWRRYDANIDNYLEIKATPDGAQNGVRTEKCDFWDEVTHYEICTSSVGVAENTALEKNLTIYPNPANSTIEIKFTIPNSSFITLKIYNTLGQEVETVISEYLTEGEYNTSWNASNCQNGMYYYTLQAGEQSITNKLMIVK